MAKTERYPGAVDHPGHFAQWPGTNFQVNFVIPKLSALEIPHANNEQA